MNDAAGRELRGRILLLSPEPADGLGGTEHAVRGLATGLRSQGYDVAILDLHTVAPWLWKFVGPLDKRLAAHAAEFFLSRAARVRSREGVVAIISNSDVGVLPLLRRREVKWIHFYHGTYRGQAEAIRPFISRLGYLYLKCWNSMILERGSGRGKLVVCNSDQTSAEVRKFFQYDAKTVWYPLDTDHFRPLDTRQARSELGISGDGVGLFVGSLSPTKNFAMVRALIAALPGVQWIVALRGDVSKQVLDHPRVRLFRNVTGADLPRLYSAADFSICPSLYESFGAVVAESLACGTPVVATQGGAGRRFLREAPLDRLLIPDPHSLLAFRRAVEGVLNDPNGYRQAVIERVRPELEKLLGIENWMRNFAEVVGL